MTTLDERHGDGAREGEGVRGQGVPGLFEADLPAAVPLDRPGAALPLLAGSKAANLARAARAGLPVLPGFVIPPGGGGDMRGSQPGPVAETLPEQLQPLEEDLWVAPMARGLATALDIAGSAPRRLLRTAPVVTTVGGRAAADLRLVGAARPPRPWLALLNPAPGYLVQTGEQSSATAVRRNLAVGPPSIEQIYYGLNLSASKAEQPPLPVVMVSRLLDAPRRIWASL